MNETNYAYRLIKRTIAIIIYLIFGSTFSISTINMIFNNKFNLQRLVIFSLIIFFISFQIVKSVKEIISVIKSIKETKKINIYFRNIGQVFIGVFVITIISSILFSKLKIELTNIFYKVMIIGVVIGVIFIIVDRIMEAINANNIMIEIDKSNE